MTTRCLFRKPGERVRVIGRLWGVFSLEVNEIVLVHNTNSSIIGSTTVTVTLLNSMHELSNLAMQSFSLMVMTNNFVSNPSN